MLAGTKLGRYEIRQKIGSGGMGEVYLASDEMLGRRIALKVLLPEFSANSERVERFRHEAKAASTLNHPNIITIYEVGSEGELLYIATEYVDGKTLREKIDEGELTQVDSVRIAEQLADALAVAHDAHIIHRDIKPENIMIRRDGIVKILDFGLAKPIFGRKIGAEDETVRLVETQPGMVMGSVRYMSPEQARGKETDQRTDVWSLGVVLYEMLTGTNPFQGETVSDSLAAVLHVEPPSIDEVPEELQRILKKALRKNADDRYQSIKDLSLDLRELRQAFEPVSGENRVKVLSNTVSIRRQPTDEHSAATHHTMTGEQATSGAGRRWSRTQETTGKLTLGRRFIPVLLILSSVVLAFGGWMVLPKLLQSNTAAFQSIQASRLSDTGNALMAEISPDGRYAAFIDRQDGRASLAVKQISTGATMTVVPPTSLEFYQPSFSPNGDFIYYVLIDRAVGTLFRVSTLGGNSSKIIVDVDSKVTFSPDGNRFAFIRHDPKQGGDTVYIANSDGSSPEAFIQTKETGFHKFVGLDWSPDGNNIALGVFKDTGDVDRRMQVALVEVANKNIEILGNNSWLGVKNLDWLRDGTGIVLVGKASTGENSQIWHLAYPGGESRQITTDTSDYASVSVSADGSAIVTTRVDAISSIWSMDPGTKTMRQITVENKNLIGYGGLGQMSDGTLLFTKAAGRDVNIIAANETGANERSLTSGQGVNLYPAATADGRYIVFSSNRSGTMSVWRMNADGSNAIQLTSAQGVVDVYPQVAADGSAIFFSRQTSDGGKLKVMKVSIDGGEAIPLLPESGRAEGMPAVSPDGRRIIIHSFQYDEKTGSYEAAARVIGLDKNTPDPSVKETEIDIDTKEYKWAPDSKSITYISRANVDNLQQVSVADAKVVPLTDFTSGNVSNFTWSRDGKQIFLVRTIYSSDLILIKDGSKV